MYRRLLFLLKLNRFHLVQSGIHIGLHKL